MNTLQTIIDNGLAIRQIPEKVVNCYGASEKRLAQENSKAVDKVIKTGVSPEKFEKMYKSHRWNEYFKLLPNGDVTRTFAEITRVPENAGYWMVKQVQDTGSTVRWNIKTDNLAETLELAVQRWLDSN